MRRNDDVRVNATTKPDSGSARLRQATGQYCMLASSDIIVVAQETGEVIFCGSANDEG